MAATNLPASNQTIIVENMLQKKIIKLLDKLLIITPTANRDFEGELRRQGDTVIVQTVPNVDFNRGGTAGSDIAESSWAISSESLVVTEIFQLNLPFAKLSEIQSNLDLIGRFADRVAYAKANTYDQYVASLAVEGVASVNAIDQGDAQTWNVTAGDALNVINKITAMATALKKQNAFRNPYLFVNPEVEALILTSNLYTAFDKGLSYRAEGAVGMVSGFKCYRTNNLPVQYKLSITDVAVADDTLTFSIVNNKGTSADVVFTAKAAPSAAGEFDIASDAAGQQAIVEDMINGTGTPGATNYIALSTADRTLMTNAYVSCGAFSSNDAIVTMNRQAAVAEDLTNGALSAKGTVIIGLENGAVNFVNQESVLKLSDAPTAIRKNMVMEEVYGGKVFNEYSKKIVTSDVVNGA